MSPTFGSLFSGIGCIDRGLERAGWQSRWQIELDAACRQVLARHWPDVAKYEDVREVRAENVQQVPGDETAGGIPPSTVRGDGTALLVQNLFQRAGADHTTEALHTSAEAPMVPVYSLQADAGTGRGDAGEPGRCLCDLPNAASAPLRGPLPRDGRDSGHSLPCLQHQAPRGRGSDLSDRGAGLSTIPPILTPVDVIAAGFPCQNLSVAGKRAGLAGAQSGLFWEVIRLTMEMRRATNHQFPKALILENVPGLLSADRGGAMAHVIAGLADSGAVDIAWRVIDAQHWVPQRRRRVFIVALYPPTADGRVGNERAAEILSLPYGGDGDSAPRREAGQGVTPILEVGARTASDGYRDGDGIGRPGDPMYTLQAGKQHAVAGGQPARYGKGPDSEATDALVFSTTGQGWWNEGPGTLRADAGGMEQTGHLVTHALTAEGCDASEDGTGRGTPLVACPAPVAFHATQTPVSGAQCPALGASAQCGVAFVSENQRHELRETDYARQLTTGGGKPGQGYPAVRDGLVVRRLTPTECERLMALPDGWTTGHPDTSRYRMLGNGAVTTVVEWIGRRLLEASA